MKYFFLFSTVLLLVFSCQKKEEEKNTCPPKKESKKFEMYKMSEMAALMEQMYVENKMVKERILKGEPIGKFPEYFLKIHTAKFTDESDNDVFFKENAALYIDAQKLIYDDPANAKQHYNDGVKACLTCHETKCGGPIPKIKKLYID
jgi:hypothetical protein